MRTITRTLVVALAGLLAWGLLGCGGGGLPGAPTAATRTTAAVTINWPARTRGIPVNAESLLVKLSDSNGFDVTKVADRPADGSASTLTFEVPAGRLFVTAEAYPAQDATGNPLAIASSEMTTQVGTPASLRLAMQSAVASLTIGSESQTINVGESRHLTATPVDAAGLSVLCAPEKLQWSSSAAGVLAVDAYGNIRGMTAGTATVTARETDSGATATLAFTVQVGPDGAPRAAEYTANAAVLPADGSVSVTQTAAGVLTLGGAAPVLNAGDIVVSDKDGLMVKVVSATRTRAGGVTVQVVPAAINEAYQQLDIDQTITVGAADDVVITSLDPNVTIVEPSRATRWTGDIDPTLVARTFSFRGLPIVPGAVTASGTVGLTLTARFAIRIDLGGVQYLKATVTPTISSTVTFDTALPSVGLSLSPKTWKTVCASISTKIWIPSTPIFVMPVLSVGPDLSFSGEGIPRVTFSGRVSATVGMEIPSKGATPRGIAEFQHAFDVDASVADLQQSVTVTASPMAITGKLLIEGIAGPTVTVKPYVKGILSRVVATPQYSLDLQYGAVAEVGVTAGLGDILKGVNVGVSWTYPIADTHASFSGFPKVYGLGGGATGGGGTGGGTVTPGGANVTIN